MERVKFEGKYLVAKIEDAGKYLTGEEEAQLYDLLRKIERGRRSDGKKSNEYVVVNRDEPYAPVVEEIMRAYGHCAKESLR